jgi:hypothetical protein
MGDSACLQEHRIDILHVVAFHGTVSVYGYAQEDWFRVFLYILTYLPI